MNPDSQIEGNINMSPYLVVQRLVELRDEVTWAEYRAALRIAIEMLSGKRDNEMTKVIRDMKEIKGELNTDDIKPFSRDDWIKGKDNKGMDKG